MIEPFLVRAALCLLVLAPVLAVVGMLVVAKRQAFVATIVGQSAMVGVGLGIALGESIDAPIGGVFIATSFTAVVMVWLRRHSQLPIDTASGVMLAATMGVGACAMAWVSRVANSHRVEATLLGDVLTLTTSDVIRVVIMAIIALAVVMLLQQRWRRSMLVPAWQPASHVAWLDYAFALVTAWVVVAALPVVGGLLVEGLMVLPAVAASRLAVRWRTMGIVSIIIAWLACLGGLWLSSLTSLPVGGAVVVLLAMMCAVVVVVGVVRKG